MNWATENAGIIGTERGFVEYSIDHDQAGRVSLGFNNPSWPAENTCNITYAGSGHFTYHSCYPGPGIDAKFTYGFRIEGIPAQAPGGAGGGTGSANGGGANGGLGGNANGGNTP